MIDPEFWLDEEVSSISPMARLLYIGLWGICDDNFATLPNNPAWIRIQVLPYEDSPNVQGLLAELYKIGKIELFLAEDGKEYWYIRNFFKHQRIDRPSKPKYPEFTRETKTLFAPTRTTLDEPSTHTRPEVKLSKDKIIEDKGSSETDVSRVKPIKKTFLQGDQWNQLIDLFEPLNPMWEDFYSNRTERKALDEMAKKITFDKLLATIKALPEITSLPFAPKITKPTELKRDFGKLLTFYKQGQAQITVKKVKII